MSMTREERMQKRISRLEERKEFHLKQYFKTEFKKHILWMILIGIGSIFAMAVILFSMFHIWNYFNPTQDYLYFIVIYAMFGNILNMVVFAYAESCIKKHKLRKISEMKLKQRQITNYFDYQIRDEYERAGHEWSN